MKMTLIWDIIQFLHLTFLNTYTVLLKNPGTLSVVSYSGVIVVSSSKGYVLNKYATYSPGCNLIALIVALNSSEKFNFFL